MKRFVHNMAGMIIIILLSITHSDSLLSQQGTEILPLIDDRAVGYNASENHWSTYGLMVVGSDDGTILRGSSMWSVEYAINIYSGEIYICTDSEPSANYNVKMRHMNSDPRNQSKYSLYEDIGNGTTYNTYTIPKDGLYEYKNLTSSYCDYIENNMSNNWAAAGFQAENEANGIESNLTMRDLRVPVDYLITTGGTLSRNEKWVGTVNLTDNISVPSGKKLFIAGATVYLNNKYIKSTGGTIIVEL